MSVVDGASTILLRSSTKPSVEVVNIDEELPSSEFLTRDKQNVLTVTEPASPAALAVEKKNVASIWTRRLITYEDPFSIHKLSFIAYSISAILIIGSVAVRYFESTEVFAVIPKYLKLPTNIFTISNIIICTVFVQMAFSHRRYDLTTRNGFLGVASYSIFWDFYCLWTSPFRPEIFNNHPLPNFALQSSCVLILRLSSMRYSEHQRL